MKKFAITLCLAAIFAVPTMAQDPCSQTTKLNASASGVKTWNGTVGATTVGGSGDDSYGVEAWTEAGGNATKLTWFGPNQGGGFAFRAEWTNSTDYLGRFGYYWGTNGKKWNNLGDLCVDYNYTRSANGTGGSYSYIGVYGWTIGNNTSAEYYIVEDWFGNGQQAANNLGNNCQTHNNITVDGRTYQVVTCIRPQGSGCVGCNNQAFGQVFSIRQGMANNSNKCGTISIKKHFEEWMKQTTEKSGQSPAKYIYDKTYESKFLAEAQGGTGWFEASYMKFSRTGCNGTSGGTSSNSTGGTSSSSKASSSSTATQATTCPSANLVTYGTVPANPYTACFKHTNGKCYVCKVSSEGDGNTCASSWVWNNVANVDDNLSKGYWYQEVTCPATSSSSVASSSSRASSSSVASSSSRASSNSVASSSSRASSSSVASSSSRASSSSVASSSSRASSSSSAGTTGSTSSSSGTSASNVSSSSSAENVSSSSEDPTPILGNRVPVTYFSIQPQSDKSLRIEISSPAVVEIFDLKGNKVERFNVSSTQQTVKLSSPSGVYFAKVHGMKSIRFVLK